MSWGDRSCIQKTMLIVAIIAFIFELGCLAVNLATLITAAKNYWFTLCSDCQQTDDMTTCGKNCCQNCTKKDAAFFYIFRLYTIFFAILAMMAEFPRFKFFRAAFKIFKFYWGRGFLQVFIGFLTITGGQSQRDANAALYAEILGYILMGMGGLHFLFSCLCFKEYSEESRASAGADYGSDVAGGEYKPQI